MFYSHTFLARKGPLGTVWSAAHLQNRLKKSHYTSTDISSTVALIMFPEVPMALRMSSHLLLGVVRIYSKKVDYLYKDCNNVLIGIKNAFASVDLNLPEDAKHAPFHSVTLPGTFELDALNLDDDFYCQGIQDNHLRSQEEITLEGSNIICAFLNSEDIISSFSYQIPAGRDPYITITFDEDIVRNSSCLEDASGPGDRTMEESAHLLPMDTTLGSLDPGPSNQTGADERLDKDSSNQNFPEFEVLRDSIHDFHSENILVWPDREDDVIEPDMTLEQQIMEKEVLTPVMEEMLVSGGQSLPSQQHQEPPTSVASEQAPEIFDSQFQFGHASPELGMRSTPPVQQPEARPRKRKRLYDESTVLTNKFMKKALEDPSDLLRKRKNCPYSALDIWKSNNRLKREKVFVEPLTTGLLGELCNIFKKDFISAKPHLVLLEEVRPESSVPPSPAHDIDLGIEHLRDYEGPACSNILPELGPSPNRFTPSPSRGDDFTPASPNNLGSQSEPQLGTTIGTGMLNTPDLAASTGPIGSEMETPMTFSERLDVENSVLSDIPEVLNSAESEDLNFLVEDNNNTPTGLEVTPGVDQLPVRTRATAQYIKRKSLVTPITEDLSGNLILNKILEGKNRKICARMFSEILVLKVYELLDVQQEEPYGDITLKVTLKLSKDQSLS
ncbi:sister chromatid cohesion 1 protein 3-like [Cornus florida]|uniref:sister chromatid cohesion 1 protein 3-like n=1 Tax=Cornus florida TaxID=4283 RepID=UPI00289B4953|nr:sister chromatid cohesion 1 protein 3-like [Cornus florida]